MCCIPQHILSAVCSRALSSRLVSARRAHPHPAALLIADNDPIDHPDAGPGPDQTKISNKEAADDDFSATIVKEKVQERIERLLALDEPTLSLRRALADLLRREDQLGHHHPAGD